MSVTIWSLTALVGAVMDDNIWKTDTASVFRVHAEENICIQAAGSSK
jgi:hypothetical protein